MGTTVFIFQQKKKKKKVSFETYIERKKKQFSQITLTSHFGIMTLENNFHLSSPFPFWKNRLELSSNSSSAWTQEAADEMSRVEENAMKKNTLIQQVL